jgi:ring-1,2-phenylacetyl-CoA epoxidase subunit PaaA
VINGRGICNKERMKARRDAHENGAWVREAANAYARKKASKTIAA